MIATVQTGVGVTHLGSALTPLGMPIVHALNAGADTYVGPAVSALQNSNSYVDSAAQVSESVSGAFNGSPVAVVVLPDVAFNNGLDATAVANQIGSQAQGKFKTVIVISDSGKVGVAGNHNADISTAIYSSIGTGKTSIAAVNAQSNKIISLANQGAHTSTGAGTGGSADDATGAIVGTGGATLGVFALIAVAGYFIKRGSNRKQQTRVLTSGPETIYVPASKFSKYLPERLQALAKQLDDIARKHSKLTNDDLTAKIATIINNLQELFNRIQKQGAINNSRIAEVEYVDKLNKLVEALGPNYYLDIAAKPDLWDEPQARMHAVEEAVDAVEYQLVENIKQVNASKDLQFRVALDTLMGSKTITAKDIYKPNTDKEKESK